MIVRDWLLVRDEEEAKAPRRAGITGKSPDYRIQQTLRNALWRNEERMGEEARKTKVLETRHGKRKAVAWFGTRCVAARMTGWEISLRVAMTISAETNHEINLQKGNDKKLRAYMLGCR